MADKKKVKTTKAPVKKATVKKGAAKQPAANKPAVAKTAKKPVKNAAVKKTAAQKPATKTAATPAAKISPASERKIPKAPRAEIPKPPARGPESYPSDTPTLMEVEAKKFDFGFQEPAPAAAPGPPPVPRELQDAYGENMLSLLVRDPEWVFAYWEIAEETRQAFRTWEKALILRWYDITDIEFNGFNAHRIMDTEVGQQAWSWYQRMPEAGRHWCAELGVMENGGRFAPICRSPLVKTPPAHMAAADIPAEWIFVDPNNPRRIFRIPPGVSIRDLLAAANISEDLLREIRIPQGLSLKEIQAYYEDLLGPNLSSWLLGQGGAGISSWLLSYPGSRSGPAKAE